MGIDSFFGTDPFFGLDWFFLGSEKEKTVKENLPFSGVFRIRFALIILMFVCEPLF